MTTDKNNFCYPGATAPGFKIAAQLRGEKEDVVFTSCSSCFQKNLQARSVENVDDWELGLCPRPRKPANHRRLTGIRGMGWNPIFKSSSTHLHFYTANSTYTAKSTCVSLTHYC
jgi:hypothetical protein